MEFDTSAPTADFDPDFEEAEMLELGLAHELVNDEVYLPAHPSRDWIRCFVAACGPQSFRMYIEGKKKVRFLLSAKHFGSGSSSYLISSSEEFPELDSRPKRGYVARLDKQRDQSYSLILNHCHLCDNRLGFFCCGRGPHEREVVAKISHYFQRFQAINLDYKCIKVQIPSISKSGKRKIWCPRAFRNACPSLNNDVNVEMSIKDLDANSIFTFRNQVPEWNAELKSLVVRFQGNRVLIPSARNFLLCWGPDESERSYTTRSSSDSSSPVHSHHKQPTLIPHALMKEKDKDRDNTQQASTVVPSSNTSVGSSSHGRQRTASHRSDSFHSNGGGTPRGNVSQKRSATASSSAMSPKDGMAANARPRTNSTNSFQSLQQRMTSGSIDAHSDAILQFGKCSPSRFTLDFRYPLSPLQAFGIALANFASEQPPSGLGHLKGSFRDDL